ncbi:hypothetical protein GCM10027176_50950 [Actinoallomurus bryophytorum]|uniref:Uncharacterized protein n=1 Tax=Actinoallomurus bryophytorum TaxID=1490222 RepID=A0A543CIB9_9ACTN|nr:hypothetical protein FB559_2200 [Actinoallomurus bryophytorum]
MTPAVERLVRLMVLLPGHDHPLWESVIADCQDTTEVMSMRWFVGDATKMWPEAAPRNLAHAVLTAASQFGVRPVLPGDAGVVPHGAMAGLVVADVLPARGNGPETHCVRITPQGPACPSLCGERAPGSPANPGGPQSVEILSTACSLRRLAAPSHAVTLLAGRAWGFRDRFGPVAA